MLTDGRLVRVLADWCPPFAGYHLYYPSRRQPYAAFTLLVERCVSGARAGGRAPRLWIAAPRIATLRRNHGKTPQCPWPPAELEADLRAAFPDAQIVIEDLAGDGDHYKAESSRPPSPACRACASISLSMPPLKEKWAAPCTPWRWRPPPRLDPSRRRP